MSKKLKCIMLVDDDSNDNFFHERVIMQNDFADVVIAKQTGLKALEYLQSEKENQNLHPNLIFLDINMPGMNGWEFLDRYKALDEKFRSEAVVIMLTTSENPDDIMKARVGNITSDFKTKPLTKEMLDDIMNKYFK